MMVSDEMGDIPAGNSKGLGLYFSDTRFVSTYEFRLNRLQPILLSASVDESYVATFQMVNPVLLLDEGKRRIPQQSLSIRRSRFIYGGLHERIGIQNCGTEPVLSYLYDDALQALQGSYRRWHDNTTRISTDNAFLDRGLLRRSQMDLRILLEEFDSGLFPMAGIPWFSAPFGRDALIASIQTLMLNPEVARGTLRYLAQHQGQKADRSREEEPGKILHEVRYGDLANLKLIPHTPYYGSVDSTPLFLVAAVEMMDWLNDQDLFVELLPAILGALKWVDLYGDSDHDGFVEYAERASGGVRNQGWKDSHDSLLYPDGRPVELPVALVEVQGYVYQAKVGLSRILERLGQPVMAERLAREAAELRRRFELAFWLDREQFYAQGLDRQKVQIPSITSNPAHGLWAGIIDPERAEILRDRLMAPDMFSGWGIRTLSADSPHYNPMSYHNGTIWPHDNSIAVAGLRRYRHAEAAGRVIEGIM